MLIIPFLLGLAVGAGTSIQSSVNAALGRVIGLAESSFISLMGSVIIVLLLMLFGFRSGNFHSITQVPPYLLIGGLFGVAYLTTANYVVPLVGVAAFISTYVTGQLVMSVLLDQFGAFGHTPHPLDAMRVLGVVLLLIGMRLVIR